MQAVILTAGRGTRMNTLTQNIPKGMLRVLGKTLLEYKLDILPKEITEVVLIVGYKKETIKKYFGKSYRHLQIRYIEDKTLTGTMHALQNAKKILRSRFLVMMGDDIYSERAIRNCAKHDWSIACKPAKKNDPGSRVILDKNKNLVNFKNTKDAGIIFTGLYSMTTEIFKYKPVKLETKNEWGIPQTLLTIKNKSRIKIIRDKFWISISSPIDLRNASKIINSL